MQASRFLGPNGLPNGSEKTDLQHYFDWFDEKKEIQEKFKVVLRKQGWFCQRCGGRKELMYEGKLIKFEETHVCNPKDVLKKKIQVMDRGW